MNALAIKNWAIAIAALIAVYVLFLIYRWFSKKGVGGVASDTAGFVADVTGGLFEGTVKGVSRTVGIPDTDPNKCAADRAAGNWFQAIGSCDAGTYTKALFNRVFSVEPLKNNAVNVVPAGVVNAPKFTVGESFFPQ